MTVRTGFLRLKPPAWNEPYDQTAWTQLLEDQLDFICRAIDDPVLRAVYVADGAEFARLSRAARARFHVENT